MMFSLGRILLTLVFLLWSLLLLGGSGLIGWAGDGLAGVLAQMHLGWLASAAAGIGKAIIMIVWIVSAIIYAIFFVLAGQLRRAAQQAARTSESSSRPSSQPSSQGDPITLNRESDGSYR
jgi:hypothetical protein